MSEKEAGEQIRKANTPTEAIEQAASSFREGQKKEEKASEKEREEQKTKDQQDIDDALKEFEDFLDGAKGSSVLDKFMRKGLEGNDKAQASLLDAFTLTNEAQRMFLKDLLRLASKVGYAYIKSGVHDAQAWSKKMADGVGRKLREVLGWDDAVVGEFVDEVWQQKYTVDGVRMRLSEHAERLKNGKGADTAVNVNKTENNETENNVNLQQEQKENSDDRERESNAEADRMQREGDSQKGVGRQNIRSHAGVSQGESSRGGTTSQGGLDSDIQERGNVRQGDSGVQEGNESVLGSAERSDRPVQRLNLNNNHEERGTESAPLSAHARIDANIQTIEFFINGTEKEVEILPKGSGTTLLIK
jgi:uncharacterized protein YjgD (DUF1641 family)